MTLIICHETETHFERVFQVSDLNNLDSSICRELVITDNSWLSVSITKVALAMANTTYKFIDLSF